MYPETVAKLILWQYFAPVLIVFGIFGNGLSMYVLVRRNRAHTSTSTYLTALAASDIVILSTGLLRQWIIYVFGLDIRLVHDTLCRGHMFIVSLSCQYSSWCLVIVTVERVLCVWKPHAVKVGCTKSLAHFVVWAVLAALALLNSHVLFGFHLTDIEHNNHSSNVTTTLKTDDTVKITKECTDKDVMGYAEFSHFVWPWIDACVMFVIPFFVLLWGNFIILKNIRHSRRFRREILASRQARMTLNSGTSRSQAPLLPLKTMLLMLNSIFFLTVGPVTIFSIGQFYWWPNDIPEGREYEVATLIWAVINILMYLNNAVNFILYILCGSEFRKEVRKIISPCCHGYRSLPTVSSVKQSDSRLHRGRSSTDFTSSL